jgi:recombination protein RecA
MAVEKKVSPEESLKSTLAAIEKQFGKGAVMKLGDKSDVKVDVLPSGCLSLDHALGVGGYPRGRVVEIYGPESSGKTTVALHAVAATQKS